MKLKTINSEQVPIVPGAAAGPTNSQEPLPSLSVLSLTLRLSLFSLSHTDSLTLSVLSLPTLSVSRLSWTGTRLAMLIENRF